MCSFLPRLFFAFPYSISFSSSSRLVSSFCLLSYFLLFISCHPFSSTFSIPSLVSSHLFTSLPLSFHLDLSHLISSIVSFDIFSTFLSLFTLSFLIFPFVSSLPLHLISIYPLSSCPCPLSEPSPSLSGFVYALLASLPSCLPLHLLIRSHPFTSFLLFLSLLHLVIRSFCFSVCLLILSHPFSSNPFSSSSQFAFALPKLFFFHRVLESHISFHFLYLLISSLPRIFSSTFSLPSFSHLVSLKLLSPF